MLNSDDKNNRLFAIWALLFQASTTIVLFKNNWEIFNSNQKLIRANWKSLHFYRTARYNIVGFNIPFNSELKQATFLSTRTAAGSKLRRYKWRMMASAVLVWNQQRQSVNFHVHDFKQERLTPSFAIYNDATYFRLPSVLTKTSLA